MRPLTTLIVALSLVCTALPASALTTLQTEQQQAGTPDGGDKQKVPDAQAPDAKPNPDALGLYHLSKDVTAPKIIHSIDPYYPNAARDKHVEGSCVVGLIVDEKGAPQGVHILRSLADGTDPKLHDIAIELDQNAVKAVNKYRFKPATYQGKPVRVELRVTVTYRYW